MVKTSPTQGGVGKRKKKVFGPKYQVGRASLVAQLVKNLPAMQETWVQRLGWEDPLEEGRACQPSPLFLPGESPWTEESSGLQSMGWQRVEHD